MRLYRGLYNVTFVLYGYTIPWVHASCEGISPDDYKSLTSLTSTTDNVTYYCSLNQCLTRVKQIVFEHFTKPSKSTENIQSSPAAL